MKKTNKIILKNATIEKENEKVLIKEFKKDTVCFECELDEIYNNIDDMGSVKLAINSESTLSADEAKAILGQYINKTGISITISSEEEF